MPQTDEAAKHLLVTGQNQLLFNPKVIDGNAQLRNGCGQSERIYKIRTA
jgi:hypothetical protein